MKWWEKWYIIQIIQFCCRKAIPPNFYCAIVNPAFCIHRHKLWITSSCKLKTQNSGDILTLFLVEPMSYLQARSDLLSGWVAESDGSQWQDDMKSETIRKTTNEVCRKGTSSLEALRPLLRTEFWVNGISTHYIVGIILGCNDYHFVQW